MKRSERNKVKTDADGGHPCPNQGEADKNKRHIDGAINVRGEVEAKFPPDLVKKYDSGQEKSGTREDKKLIVEVLTLIVVAIRSHLCRTDLLASLF